MMRITTILGSPRKKGNTATVLGMFEELCSATHEVDRINIAGKNVKGCLGCDQCQQILDEPGCVQKDDFNEIITKILNSDLIVYASPVYVWDFSAQLKVLMDRHYCLVKWKQNADIKSLMEFKQTALLVTCGGDAVNNADLIQEIFTREMNYLRCRIRGKYAVPLCPSRLPTQIGEKAKLMSQQMYADLIK